MPTYGNRRSETRQGAAARTRPSARQAADSLSATARPLHRAVRLSGNGGPDGLAFQPVFERRVSPAVLPGHGGHGVTVRPVRVEFHGDAFPDPSALGRRVRGGAFGDRGAPGSAGL